MDGRDGIADSMLERICTDSDSRKFSGTIYEFVSESRDYFVEDTAPGGI